MYEETEYFKRFAKCYLMWSHSNMDRIVREIISKDAEAEIKRKEEARLAPYKKQMTELFLNTNLYFDKIAADDDSLFMSNEQWNESQIGSMLKIRLSGERNL